MDVADESMWIDIRVEADIVLPDVFRVLILGWPSVSTFIHWNSLTGARKAMNKVLSFWSMDRLPAHWIRLTINSPRKIRTETEIQELREEQSERSKTNNRPNSYLWSGLKLRWPRYAPSSAVIQTSLCTEHSSMRESDLGFDFLVCLQGA